MESKNRWGIWMGLFLMGLGGLFLIGQFMNIDVWRFVWPLMLLAAGSAFFAGMVSGGRSASGLAVPGSLFVTFGLIMLIQSIFQSWTSWAYTWTLLVAAVGAGLLIMGYWGNQPDLRPVGRALLVVGLVLFLLFGLVFELGALLLGQRNLGGIFFPLALILGGLYILFGRNLFQSLGRRWEYNAQQPAAVDGERGITVESLPARSTEISGVRRVHFRALGDLTILQGEREGLEIEASGFLRDRIRAEMRGDTLDLRIAMEWWEWLNPAYWGPQPVRYRLFVRQIEAFQSSGVGRTVIPQLLVPRLSVEQSGAGEIQIQALETGELVARLSGVGSTEIRGRADSQDASISGVGSYRADRLQCNTARVNVSGVGSASVWVTGSLDARLSGTGNISYYGNPQVQLSRSGVGNIQSQGAR